MLTKQQKTALKKSLKQSQERLAEFKANRTSAAVAVGDDQEVIDIICTLAKAFQAECDFLKGNITIAAAVKAAGKPCNCE